MKRNIVFRCFLLVSLFRTAPLFAQVNDVDAFENLARIAKTDRISNDIYHVMNYQKKGFELSNITILTRKVEHTEFGGKKCIKVTESDSVLNSINKTIIFIAENN